MGFCDPAGHWAGPAAAAPPSPAQQGTWTCTQEFSAYSKICALMYFVFLSLCYCLLCAAEALRALPAASFKALPSSHFGPADCLEALVYEQVFNAFFTGGHQRGFFLHGANVAIFFCPFPTSVIVRDVGVFPHVAPLYTYV